MGLGDTWTDFSAIYIWWAEQAHSEGEMGLKVLVIKLNENANTDFCQNELKREALCYSFAGSYKMAHVYAPWGILWQMTQILQLHFVFGYLKNVLSKKVTFSNISYSIWGYSAEWPWSFKTYNCVKAKFSPHINTIIELLLPLEWLVVYFSKAYLGAKSSQRTIIY